MKAQQQHYVYHLTTQNKVKRILSKGLKPGPDGYIYMLQTDDVEICSYVAFNQLFIYRNLALVQIDISGITSLIEKDNVAEVISPLQIRVKQECILPEFLFSFRGLSEVTCGNYYTISTLVDKVTKSLR